MEHANSENLRFPEPLPCLVHDWGVRVATSPVAVETPFF